MLVQVNTDNHSSGREAVETYYTETLNKSLSRFEEHITRVEVYLGDENNRKKGPNDKRCILEARLEGMQPVAVTSHADDRDRAFKLAIDKLKSALDSIIGRQRDR